MCDIMRVDITEFRVYNVMLFFGKRGTVTVHLEPDTKTLTPSLNPKFEVHQPSLTLLPRIEDFLDFENLRPSCVGFLKFSFHDSIATL
jgi:hypothetical protein